MHGMHARLPKNFVLEERLATYADAIELEPWHYADRWAHACWPLGLEDGASFDEVRLDLGCGKGAFVCEAATREPNVLFVAMDAEPLCVAYAAQHVMESGLANVVIVPGKGSLVSRAFGAHELGCIYLNFPTPYPRKKDASKRLVILERLLEYREVLTPGGTLRLRTDSQPLRDFALTQLALAGYDVVWSSDDARRDHPHEPTSEYEQRLAAQGAKVLSVWATPGEPPVDPEQTASLSLVDYFPEDLFENGYVPHGMGGAVINLRNRRRNSQTGSAQTKGQSPNLGTVP